MFDLHTRAATKNLDETTTLTRELLALLGAKAPEVADEPVERARIRRPKAP